MIYPAGFICFTSDPARSHHHRRHALQLEQVLDEVEPLLQLRSVPQQLTRQQAHTLVFLIHTVRLAGIETDGGSEHGGHPDPHRLYYIPIYTAEAQLRLRGREGGEGRGVASRGVVSRCVVGRGREGRGGVSLAGVSWGGEGRGVASRGVVSRCVVGRGGVSLAGVTLAGVS